MTRPVRTVAVVGRDADAWLTALALQRSVATSGVRVIVVEPVSRIPEDLAYVAAPSLRALHRLLGIDDAEVFVRCHAVPMLGQRYSAWSVSAPPFIHAFDPQWPAIDGLPFFQHWLKATEEGLKVSPEDFSATAVASKHGRISPTSGVGYQISAPAYVELLRAKALAAGVRCEACTDLHVVQQDGLVTSVQLDGGRLIDADLFVDATGPAALLLNALVPGGQMSLQHLFPCDRLLITSTPALSPFPAFSEVHAFAGGWVGQYPLQDRTSVMAVYSSGMLSDEAALAEVARICGRAIGAHISVASIAAGVIREPWAGNVVAVGGAMATLEPLDAMQLHLVHIGISNLIGLWPVDAERMIEADIYNRDISQHLAGIIDFQSAHYRVNGRNGDPFWDQARSVALGEELTERLRLFEARGETIARDRETFDPQNWIAAFVGHGLRPRSFDPRVRRTPRQAQMESFRRHLHVIAREVQAMPTVETWLSTQGAAA